MTLPLITFNQILIIFIIIVAGIICYKVGLIDDATNSKLSNILLMLVNPIVIFTSYQRDFSKNLLQGLLISLLLSVITHIISILISYIIIRKKRRRKLKVDGKTNVEYVSNNDVEVERLSCIYSNVGFMGIPLVNGILGSEGVFYVTAAITIYHMFLWTHGVIVMSGSKDLNIKGILKRLLSPSIIAITLGFICFVLQIRMPDVVNSALNHIAGLNTPFAMLIAGVTIARANIFKLLVKYRIYMIAFLKLLFIPIICLLLYSRFRIYDKVLITAAIMAASPSATSNILFSIKYNKNSVYAAEIFTVTTLLCAATLPLIVALTEFLT